MEDAYLISANLGGVKKYLHDPFPKLRYVRIDTSGARWIVPKVNYVPVAKATILYQQLNVSYLVTLKMKVNEAGKVHKRLNVRYLVTIEPQVLKVDKVGKCFYFLLYPRSKLAYNSESAFLNSSRPGSNFPASVYSGFRGFKGSQKAGLPVYKTALRLRLPGKDLPCKPKWWGNSRLPGLCLYSRDS